MKAYVYWLHLSEHTNFSEGYIGVSVNTKDRIKEHKKRVRGDRHENIHLQRALKKYGDKVIQNIIWVGEEKKCYKIEEELRPKKYMGWNIAEGGCKPPNRTGEKWTTTQRELIPRAGKRVAIGKDRTKAQKDAAKAHSKRMTGRKQSPEHLKTRSEAVTLWWGKRKLK